MHLNQLWKEVSVARRTRRMDRRRYATTIERVRPRWRTHSGQLVRMRLLEPTDANALRELFYRLSPESRRRRFHADVERIDAETIAEAAVTLSDVDNKTMGGAVIALAREGDKDAIVGVARLARPLEQPASPEAEAAITVRDDFHGQGLGTELLRRMVLLARRMEIETMVAEIEADNHGAIRLFRRLNLPTETEVDHGEVVLRINVSSSGR
jgi:RimJ/RimL family protein N-acetyltransferase